jgi:hypothetical protein
VFQTRQTFSVRGGYVVVESPVNTMMAQVLLPALIDPGASRQPLPNGVDQR